MAKELAGKLMNKLHLMSDEEAQYVKDVNCMNPNWCTAGMLLNLQEIEKRLDPPKSIPIEDENESFFAKKGSNKK